MKIKKILVVCKQSRLKEHRMTIRVVERTLRALKIPYRKRGRHRLQSLYGYDLVLPVGGDGTFLTAAGLLEEGILMGVNSAPTTSVGFFCGANRSNFKKKMLKILKGDFELFRLSRLRLKIPRRKKGVLVINDVLFTNRNPAAMSRYRIKIGKLKEEHRSSGVWIGPAAGSRAGIHSAGGRVLPIRSERFQFVVREPYRGFKQRYRFRKGVLRRGKKIQIRSLMDGGAVYVDGPHMVYPVRQGDRITISCSRRPLSVVW